LLKRREDLSGFLSELREDGRGGEKRRVVASILRTSWAVAQEERGSFWVLE